MFVVKEFIDIVFYPSKFHGLKLTDLLNRKICHLGKYLSPCLVVNFKSRHVLQQLK